MIDDEVVDAERRRLFYALWPDEDTRAQLQAAQATLTTRGDAVPPENLHLTLAFLGGVARELEPDILAAGVETAFRPFDMVLDQPGYFRRNKITWLGLRSVPPPLLDLRRELVSRINTRHPQWVTGRFTPHVTLARKAKPPGHDARVWVRWRVCRFCLVHSRVTDAGSQYTVVHEFSGVDT